MSWPVNNHIIPKTIFGWLTYLITGLTHQFVLDELVLTPTKKRLLFPYKSTFPDCFYPVSVSISEVIVYKTPFTKYSYVCHTQEWFNQARDNILHLCKTLLLVSILVGWLCLSPLMKTGFIQHVPWGKYLLIWRWWLQPVSKT